MENKWNTPKGYCGNPFGPENINDYLPSMDEIPDEFKRYNGTKWHTVVSDWFFHGLKNAQWEPKDGINANEAVGHVATCMCSWEPKHEHKEAGCAYLLSLWFDSVIYDKE